MPYNIQNIRKQVIPEFHQDAHIRLYRVYAATAQYMDWKVVYSIESQSA